MLGILLASIGALFEEISNSIGKRKVESREESPYTMAFLSLFGGTVFLIAVSIIRNDFFVFRLESLPTFSIRAVLEIVQLYVTAFAIVRADRSTFCFLRILTIPLLLFVDALLGYKLGFSGVIGISIIVLTMLVLFSRQEIKKAGAGFVIFSAVNAVFTISLFKYDITHFNSVAAEQLFIYLILLATFFLFAFFRAEGNPCIFLTKPTFILQSFSVGFGGLIESFAYNYGAASLIVAAKRSAAIFWSLLSGRQYFGEKNIIFKISVSFVLVVGLVFLAMN